MANADSLRLQVRNRAAEVVRVAGRIARDGMREVTPRSDQPGAHTADRWNVDYLAAPDLFIASITNNSQVVTWLNDGTPPHEIRPVRAKVLRFQGRGGNTIFARVVNHPGSARHAGFVGRFLNDAGWRQALIQADESIGPLA